MGKARFDKLDRRIIAALAVDGRRPYRDIARMLDVSEGTIRQRVGRLLDDGHIRISAVGTPIKVGIDVVAMLQLKVKPGHVEETAAIFKDIPNVRFVAISFGSADILMQTLHSSVGDLHRFVFQEIPQLAPAVTHTETFQLTDVVKSTWNWGEWYDYLDLYDSDEPATDPVEEADTLVL